MSQPELVSDGDGTGTGRGRMSEKRSVSVSFAGVWFALFVGIKVAGHSLAAWSWWWIFFPIVPLIGLLVQKAGL
jgi:hypothetical protein